MGKLSHAIEAMQTLAAANMPSETAEDRESYARALTILQSPAAEGGVIVYAYVAPGKRDWSATAIFANSNRAEKYAEMLAATGDYAEVSLTIDGIRHSLHR